jgi:hypothetical protein
MKVSEEKTCSAVKMSSKWIMMMRDERKIVFFFLLLIFCHTASDKNIRDFRVLQEGQRETFQRQLRWLLLVVKHLRNFFYSLDFHPTNGKSHIPALRTRRASSSTNFHCSTVSGSPLVSCLCCRKVFCCLMEKDLRGEQKK